MDEGLKKHKEFPFDKNFIIAKYVDINIDIYWEYFRSWK